MLLLLQQYPGDALSLLSRMVSAHLTAAPAQLQLLLAAVATIGVIVLVTVLRALHGIDVPHHQRDGLDTWLRMHPPKSANHDLGRCRCKTQQRPQTP